MTSILNHAKPRRDALRRLRRAGARAAAGTSRRICAASSVHSSFDGSRLRDQIAVRIPCLPPLAALWIRDRCRAAGRLPRSCVPVTERALTVQQFYRKQNSNWYEQYRGSFERRPARKSAPYVLWIRRAGRWLEQLCHLPRRQVSPSTDCLPKT